VDQLDTPQTSAPTKPPPPPDEKLDQIGPARHTRQWTVGDVVIAGLGLLGALLGAFATLYTALRTEPFIRQQTEVAVAAESRAANTEARQVWVDFLSRFDSKDIWEARTTLVRYCNDIAGMSVDASKLTAEYLAYYVYHSSQAEPHNEELVSRIQTDKPKDFFSELDKSRRLIKNFHETIMVLAANSRISKDLRKELIDTRFYNAAEFLELYWLPVEKAQNAAQHQGHGKSQSKADEHAENLIAWYRSGRSNDDGDRLGSPKPACGRR
jgi:hypothetical protein